MGAGLASLLLRELIWYVPDPESEALQYELQGLGCPC